MTTDERDPQHAIEERPAPAGLRDKVFQGGFFLLVRQGMGMGIRVLGVLALAAILTPEEYGVFVAPSAVLILLGALLPIGMPTFLIREEGEADLRDIDVVFTWSLFAGTAIAIVGWMGFLAAPSIEWLDRDYSLAFAGIATGGIFQYAQSAGRVLMDRELRFGERGAIEVIGDGLIYVVALPLALAGFGFMAPVLGQATASVWLGGAMIVRSGYRPRLSLSVSRFRRLAQNGFGYAVYGLSGHLFDATILLVSSAFLGKAGAGQVGLAQRLANRTVVLRVAVEQLSLAAVSKVQSDVSRLRRIQAESTSLHLLTTGVGVSALAYLGPVLIPFLFGEEWSDAAPVLAFLCLFQFVSLIFDMHINTLIVRKHTMVVSAQRLLQTVITAISLSITVSVYGAAGVGPGLMIGLITFVIPEVAIRRLFVPDHAAYLPYVLGMLPLYASPWTDGLARASLVVPFIVMLVLPNSRRVLMGFRHDVLRALRSR